MRRISFASVDPGKNACGVAVWYEDGDLVWAGYVPNPHQTDPGKERAERWGDMGRMVATVIRHQAHGDRVSLVLEIPQVYSGYQEADKNDLVDLSGVQGALVGASGYEVAWSPLPKEWKGQLPKEISVKRVETKLSDEEKALIQWPAKNLKHNVYDALHLGIVFLEREGLRRFVE